MKHLLFILIFASEISYGQCNKETSVQFFNSIDMAFSTSKKVSVTFGKGSEISNSNNYINFEQESLYCIINGFDKGYNVKLFTSYSNIYATNCSSIVSIFNDGYVKGKDQEGRIWKVFKPVTYNNYNQSTRKYNPVTASINTDEIKSGLSSIQSRIDYNRERVIASGDEIANKIIWLKEKISQSNTAPQFLSSLRRLNNIYSSCDDDLDLASNSSSLSTLSCLKRVNTELDILERKISNYSVNKN